MDDRNNLIKAIYNLHSCKAIWKESVPVIETYQDQIVWEGIVQVFDLIDHPTAKKCYAWSYVVDDSEKRKFIAVLHQDPVNSPEDAVKAFIVSEFKI
jgi:hypothetical protein